MSSPGKEEVYLRVGTSPLTWGEIRGVVPVLAVLLLFISGMLALDVAPQIFPAPTLPVDVWICSFLAGIGLFALVGTVLLVADIPHRVYVTVYFLAAQAQREKDGGGRCKALMAECLVVLVGPGDSLLFLLSITLVTAFLLVDALGPQPVYYVQIILGLLFIVASLAAGVMQLRVLDQFALSLDQVFGSCLALLTWISMGAGLSWSDAVIWPIVFGSLTLAVAIAALVFSAVTWKLAPLRLSIGRKWAVLVLDAWVMSTFAWQQKLAYYPRNPVYWIGLLILLGLAGVVLVQAMLSLARSVVGEGGRDGRHGWSFRRFFLGVEAFFVAQTACTCVFDLLVQADTTSSSLTQQNQAAGVLYLSLWGFMCLASLALNRDIDVVRISPLLFSWGLSTSLLYSTALNQNWVQGSFSLTIGLGSTTFAVSTLAFALVLLLWFRQRRGRAVRRLIIEPALCVYVSSLVTGGSFGVLHSHPTAVVQQRWTSFAGSIIQVVAGSSAALIFFITQFSLLVQLVPWPRRGAASPFARAIEKGDKTL